MKAVVKTTVTTENLLKNFVITTAMVIVAALSAGCAQLEQVGKALDESNRKGNVERFERQEDMVMARAFYMLNANRDEQLVPTLQSANYEFGKRASWSTTIFRKVVDREANIVFATTAARKVNADIMDDPASKLYIATAHRRGNKVVLYKSRMAAAINDQFNALHKFEPDANTRQWFDITGALIEYSPDGQIVSVMTKSRQLIATMGVSVYDYVHVRYGRDIIRNIENALPNSLFSETRIREIRLTASTRG
ncbi:hypothetical protein [Hydrogenophaga palleronii]|uniref:hypothetical protein n=1 Tax=Hydrogenophaga palleronii TaxID=65655 RepID=UPI000824A97D|nr:hypothetical protein [Hydrogenophaga palleronii]